VSLGIFGVALWNAGRSVWIVRVGHMAERHALIIIIALGEVIVAIGAPVVAALEEGKGLSNLTVIALIASGAFAGILWWTYFDRLSPNLEHRAKSLETVGQKGLFARDIYTIAHAPIVAGIIFSSAALEEIALHPGDTVGLAFRLMLGGGLLMGTIGVAWAVRRSFGVFARERLAAALLIGVLALVGGAWVGVWLLVAVDVIMVVMLVAEHVRIERMGHQPDVR
jgi:low temperature requirement protein LtrA